MHPGACPGDSSGCRSARAAATLERELDALAYSVSHDLRAPLRALDGFSCMLEEEYGDCLDATGVDYLARIRAAARRMSSQIEALLLSRIARTPVRREAVDLARLACSVLSGLSRSDPERQVATMVLDHAFAQADARLARVLMEQILANAWKFTRMQARPRIEFGRSATAGREHFHVRDNGAGFDPAYADRLFSPFQRLHGADEFEGEGVGLAMAMRVVRLHDGELWAESSPGQGAKFTFRLA